MKTYGKEKTKLFLSEKAEKAYSSSKQLIILDHSDGYYSIRGSVDRDDLTAEDVNSLLEKLYDEGLAKEK